MLRREAADPQVLRAVRVLVFVDVEVAPLLLVLGEHVGRLVEQADGLEQQVVEIERLGLAQSLLVARREPGDRALAVVRGVLREEAGVQHLVLGPADGAEDRARPELAGQRHVLLAQDLLHQRLLVVRVVDDEPSVDADRLAVRAEDPGAQRVERAGLDVAAALTDEADDPFAQFRRGPVGEGDGEDPPRRHAVDPDEIGDPVGQDAGLARPGAGQDEQRALGRRDGASLLRVEGLDDLGGPRLAGGGDRLRVRRRDRDSRVRGRRHRAASRIQAGSSGAAAAGGSSDASMNAVPAGSSSPSEATSGALSPGRRRREGLTCAIVERGVDPAFTRLS